MHNHDYINTVSELETMLVVPFTSWRHSKVPFDHPA